MRRFNAHGVEVFQDRSPIPHVTARAAKHSGHFWRLGDFASVPHNAVFNLTTALTVEAWIWRPNLTQPVLFPTIIQKGAINTAYQLFFTTSTNAVSARIKPSGSSVTVADPNPVAHSTWTHYAMTYDGTTLHLLRNGVSVANSACGTTSTNSGEIRIGESDVNINRWTGLIDDVRVWNVARTSVQIAAAMGTKLVGNESGLVGYWPFDEGRGRTAADLVAARNASLQNSDQWSTLTPF